MRKGKVNPKARQLSACLAQPAERGCGRETAVPSLTVGGALGRPQLSCNLFTLRGSTRAATWMGVTGPSRQWGQDSDRPLPEGRCGLGLRSDHEVSPAGSHLSPRPVLPCRDSPGTCRDWFPAWNSPPLKRAVSGNGIPGRGGAGVPHELEMFCRQPGALGLCLLALRRCRPGRWGQADWRPIPAPPPPSRAVLGKPVPVCGLLCPFPQNKGSWCPGPH